MNKDFLLTALWLMLSFTINEIIVKRFPQFAKAYPIFVTLFIVVSLLVLLGIALITNVLGELV